MFTIAPGRRLNMIICLISAGCACVSLIAAVAFVLLGKDSQAFALFILTLILSGFALLYGVIWFVYSRKERIAAQRLAEHDELIASLRNEDPARYEIREFTIPKDRLTETARTRFMSIVRALEIIMLAMFAVLTVILIINGALAKPVQFLYTAIFCILIGLPGIVPQWIIYEKFKNSVPERVLLFPSKLVIDEKLFPVRDIQLIRVSSNRRHNLNSTAIFREVIVQTTKNASTYRFDYRVDDPKKNRQPRWEEYPEFVTALADWGRQNSVVVKVDYMD